MDNKNKQMPKEVSTAISGIMKFLEKSEKDFLDIHNKKDDNNKKDRHIKEKINENS